MAFDISSLTGVVNKYLYSISDTKKLLDESGLSSSLTGTESSTSEVDFTSVLTDAISQELGASQTDSNVAALQEAAAKIQASAQTAQAGGNATQTGAKDAQAGTQAATAVSDISAAFPTARETGSEIADRIQAAAHRHDPNVNWFEQADFPDIENMIRQSMMSRMRIDGE
ncbi:MAG: hypothetical protein K6G10_08915 [Butyrivibrio sp.]|nr:hypothetical protein [Butyrivibrio sp.]